MDNQVVIVVIVITSIIVDTIHIIVEAVDNKNYILEIINFIKKK